MDNHGFLFQIGFRYFPFISFLYIIYGGFLLISLGWVNFSIFCSFVYGFLCLSSTYVRTMNGGF